MTGRPRARAFDPEDEASGRAYLLRLLKIRERSEREAADKLLVKGFTPRVVASTLAYARRARLIDDALFARLWVAGRIKRPLGARRLRWELRRKGIAPPLIEKALAVAGAGMREEDVVRALVRSRIARLSGSPSRKIKERLYRFLARRGFSQEIIMDVLDREVSDDETIDDA
ncbi:MAG: regulatory protein RecX [Deltaproteobacteria bacterium]